MIYLILPSYNEEKNLIKVFKKINNLIIVKKITVILIDDCSADNTKKFKFYKYKFKIIYKRHIKNMGLSIALESGFNSVKDTNKKNFIITMDSDNTHPITIIPKMIKMMKKNNSDIVIASRFLPTSKVNGLSFFRKFLSIFAKYIFSYSFPHKNLKEYTCNFRIYRPHLIKDLMKNKWGRIVSKKKHMTAKKEKRLQKHGYTAKKGKFGAVKISDKSKGGRKGKGKGTRKH